MSEEEAAMKTMRDILEQDTCQIGFEHVEMLAAMKTMRDILEQESTACNGQ